jgi:zinc and cadmium transporter
MYHPAVRALAAAAGLSVAGSLGGLLTASLVLLLGDGVRTRLVPWLLSYAVGTLLGASLLALLPEALEQLAPRTALGTLLAGILTFFLLEKLVLWRHCHDVHECKVHRSAAWLVIIGDGVHTFVDGAAIAAAVLTSFPLGVTAALAVAAHEIPQEVGDFAILLAAGFSRRRALVLNLVAAGSGLVGAVLMIVSAGSLPGLLPYVLAFAAGNFLYVSLSDLIPHLHSESIEVRSFPQVLVVAAGVATIALL